MTAGEDDVALKLVHTADWHLGKRFASFSRDAEARLRRARLEVLDRVFGVAESERADAVLCAGDLFDGPKPQEAWWRGLAERLAATDPRRPIFLLPGNHDPLLPGSVWDPAYGFRARLPAHVRVVEEKNARFPLGEGATLFASPCTSHAGHDDQALALPEREAGDESIRVGMVHGSTFDMEGWQASFPIAKDAADRRGLDYLAIGDTHAFRTYPGASGAPTVYPSAPEPSSFGEADAGYVAVVLIQRSRRARVERRRVAQWTWETHRIERLDELRALVGRGDLSTRVLRVRLALRLPPSEHEEATRLLDLLEGTEASPPRAGVLDLDRGGLELDTRDLERLFAAMPEPIREAARRLRAMEAEDPERARLALTHLTRLVRELA